MMKVEPTDVVSCWVGVVSCRVVLGWVGIVLCRVDSAGRAGYL